MPLVLEDPILKFFWTSASGGRIQWMLFRGANLLCVHHGGPKGSSRILLPATDCAFASKREHARIYSLVFFCLMP